VGAAAPSAPAENRTAMTGPALASTPAQRLLFLDVLRGVTVAFMILVNNATPGLAALSIHP